MKPLKIPAPKKPKPMMAPKLKGIDPEMAARIRAKASRVLGK